MSSQGSPERLAAIRSGIRSFLRWLRPMLFPPPQPVVRSYWNGYRWVPGEKPKGFRPTGPKPTTLFYVRGPHLGPIRFRRSRVTTAGCACLAAGILVAAAVGVVALIVG